MGIGVAVLLWITSDLVTNLIGLPVDAAQLAAIYPIILAPGIFLLPRKHTLSDIGLAIRKTRPQMIGAIVGIVTNIVLNSAVVYSAGSDITPQMLVRGVAWATVVSYAANVLVLWYFVADKKTFFAATLGQKFGAMIWCIWVTAVPTTLEPAAIQIQWLILTALVASFGIDALATRIYVLNYEMFVLTWSLAIAIAMQVLVSFEAGKCDLQAASQIVKIDNVIGGAGAAIAATLMYWYADFLVGMFTSDPDILRTASMLFLIAIPTEIAKATYNTTC